LSAKLGDSLQNRGKNLTIGFPSRESIKAEINKVIRTTPRRAALSQLTTFFEKAGTTPYNQNDLLCQALVEMEREAKDYLQQQKTGNEAEQELLNWARKKTVENREPSIHLIDRMKDRGYHVLTNPITNPPTPSSLNKVWDFLQKCSPIIWKWSLLIHHFNLSTIGLLMINCMNP